MIIVDSAFQLAESAAVATPLKNPRIGYQTWLRDLDAAAITASTETAEGPADAPLRSNTYEYWEPTALPATWHVDLGQARAIDYFGVLGAIGSRGVSVLVETSENDVDWDTFAIEQLQADDSPMMFLDDEVNRRYLRLTFSGSGSVPLVLSVYAGLVLKMPRSLYGGHAPLNMQRVTVKDTVMSRGGQFLGVSYRRHGLETGAAFKYLSPDFIRDDFQPFVKAARLEPYFFAWRPEGYPNEVGYVWTDNDIRVSNMGVREFMQTQWEMQGWGYE